MVAAGDMRGDGSRMDLTVTQSGQPGGVTVFWVATIGGAVGSRRGRAHLVAAGDMRGGGSWMVLTVTQTGQRGGLTVFWVATTGGV